MNLHYIWIDNYKNLSKVDLNFSNSIRLKYDEQKKVLRIDPSENFIPNFFGENITSLTGIIGENGVGKTSILRYILQYLTGGVNDDDKNSIIVFSHKAKYYYCSNWNITLEGSFDLKLFQKVIDLDHFKVSITNIYLSNHFDPSSFYSTDIGRNQMAGMINLSTHYLLYSDFQKQFGLDAENSQTPFNLKMEAFAIQELKRMVRVLKWINKKSHRNPFPVSIPPFLNLRTVYLLDNSRTDGINAEFEKAVDQIFLGLNSQKERFLVNAFLAGIYGIVNQGKFVIDRDSIKRVFQELFERIIHASKDHRIEWRKNFLFLDRLEMILNDITVSENQILHVQFDILKKFLQYLDKFIQIKSSRINQDGTLLSFKIVDINPTEIEGLVDDFYRIERIVDYADFYFSHQPFSESTLSSGEYVLLSLIGRLNSLNVEDGQSLIMLIDEAELGLHPQWQKEFLNILIDFISQRFKTCAIQIVITSHSPFIVSDLPPHCCIFLRKESGSVITTNSLNKTPETFGTNIHELFTDSFFLKNGLMGEFSRQKIDDLVREVYKKETFTREYFDKVKPLINIIGEPFIRQKLLEKIAAGMSPQDVDYVILDRERELNNLRTIRDDKNRAQ